MPKTLESLKEVLHCRVQASCDQLKRDYSHFALAEFNIRDVTSVYVQVDGHVDLSPALLSSMRADTLPQLHQESIATGHASILRILSFACVWHARQSSEKAPAIHMNASAIVRFSKLSVAAERNQASEPADLELDQSGLPDEVLLEQISCGCREALSSLFKRYARIVRGVAYRVLRDQSEADDLLQDIFLLVHRLCGTFDSSKGPARFWILQMTYRRAISRRRYLTSRHFYSHFDLDQAANRIADSESGSCGPESSMNERLDRQEVLQSCFTGLSESQRQTLHLFFYEGYTFEEIAAKLGQTVGNARNHYYRGLERLRKQISAGKLPGKEAV